MKNQPINEELLARYLAGETDANEFAMVENWLNEKVENKKELADFELIYNSTFHKNETPVNTDAAWLKLKSRIDANKGKVIAFQPPKKTFFQNYRIAASIAIIFSAGLILYFLTQKNIQTISFQSHDKPSETSLPDGSKVLLNKNTKLTYPSDFQGDTREVTLVGEAFFEIKRNENQPFVIHANGTDVRVLGTTFNINAYSSNVKVSVKTGKVEFSSATKKAILEKDQEAEFFAENDTIIKKINFDKNVLAYKTHIYIFEDSSLEHITKVLSEGYQVPILLKNAELKSCRLTTKFDNETLTNALNVIAETLNLKLTHENNKFYLDGEKCK